MAYDKRYYDCGSCGHYHPFKFRGDCRNDEFRFTAEELDEIHGDNKWVSVENYYIEPVGEPFGKGNGWIIDAVNPTHYAVFDSNDEFVHMAETYEAAEFWVKIVTEGELE